MRGVVVCVGPLAWLAGVAWQLQQAVLPGTGEMLALVATGLLLLLLALALGLGLALRQRGRFARLLVLLPALGGLALLGYGSTAWRGAQRLADALPPVLEGQDLWLTGRVAGLPQPQTQGTRFVFEVEAAQGPDAGPVQLPRRLMLSWYAAAPDRAEPGSDPGTIAELRAGQRWRLPVRLRQPHGNANPHGFDYELWLFEQGVRATGYVRARPDRPARLLDERAGHVVHRLRQQVRERIATTVADASAAGVLAALVVGDQGAIERADWEVFRVTGVAHLMAISGLHITMFAWFAAAGVRRAWRLSPRLLLAVPAPQAARWGGLLLATAYALLAGWAVPAQRTVVMLAVVVLLRSGGLHWPALHLLPVAALAVALADPWALLQPGFWLSFVAVGLLMAAEPAERAPAGTSWRAQLQALLRGGVRTQAVATVGLAPLTLLFFQQLSLVGFVANLAAIPLVTLLVTPLALLGTLLPLLWPPAALLLQGLMQVLAGLAAWPWAQWSVAAAPAWAVLPGLAGGLLLVLPLPWRLRLLGLPLLLPLLAPPLERPPPGRFELVAVDVGQGTAVLVRTQGHLLIYDTGPAYSALSDAGQRVLLPLLRARGEHAADLLMLSHRDSDHVGGAASLLARFPVRAIAGSLEPGHGLLQGVVPAGPCRAGQRWTWDGVAFEVLHPADDGAAGERPNARSCVLRIDGAQGSALLTGDIERAQELALVQQHGTRLASTLLLVPHHGSRTSSSEPFLAAVAPQVALVQAGYRSRFGHPAPEVVARYEARGVALLRSDRCGAWTWAPDGAMQCQRQVAARYWHHRAEKREELSR